MSSIRFFIQATRELSAGLNRLRFGPPVKFVYNPLDYAREPHEQYLRTFLKGNQPVLFLGMNPGPFGMAQTGVPFGEVAAVRDWLGITGVVGSPCREHPRRLVRGFDCARSEVSGRRLWGLFASEFRHPRDFFAGHFVYNYCPLMFLEGGETGRNITPDRLSGGAARRLIQLCDRHLLRLAECCGAETAVGVGGFAERRLRQVFGATSLRVGRILHPSPASPAANRDWAGTAKSELRHLGVW